MKVKDKGFEWSMGNGQCPCCYGNKPDVGWWTDMVGHERGCFLAEVMEGSGLEVIWEYKNPERSIGWYCPDDSGGLSSICYNDPDKEEKLAMQDEQGLNIGKIFTEALSMVKEYDKDNG